MAVREFRVFISTAGDPDFGSNYYVTAYEIGAQVASASPGTTATVRAGHGFAANDKFIVGTDTTKYRTVTVAGSTTLELNSPISLAQGDLLVNLAQDTGATSPNYDGNGLAIYTDMAYGSQATNNTVQADTNGRGRYWHQNIPRWELVRTSAGAPIAVVVDTDIVQLSPPGSSTDEAVVRWDGTGATAVQNSVVTINDTGDVAGVAGLSATGIIATSGTVSGVTITASGTVQGATVASTGPATIATTLTVSGDAGLLGALAVTGNATFSANVLRSVDAAVTASTDQSQTGGTALTKDINNVSVVANVNDAVTLPSAVAGMSIQVFNNGANTLRIYPASGDNLGAGVDTFTTLAAAANTRFTAYNTTNWEVG